MFLFIHLSTQILDLALNLDTSSSPSSSNPHLRKSERDRRSKNEKIIFKEEEVKKHLEDNDETTLNLVDIPGKGRGVVVSCSKHLLSINLSLNYWKMGS